MWRDVALRRFSGLRPHGQCVTSDGNLDSEGRTACVTSVLIKLCRLKVCRSEIKIGSWKLLTNSQNFCMITEVRNWCEFQDVMVGFVGSFQTTRLCKTEADRLAVPVPSAGGCVYISQAWDSHDETPRVDAAVLSCLQASTACMRRGTCALAFWEGTLHWASIAGTSLLCYTDYKTKLFFTMFHVDT